MSLSYIKDNWQAFLQCSLGAIALVWMIIDLCQERKPKYYTGKKGDGIKNAGFYIKQNTEDCSNSPLDNSDNQ